MEKDLFREFNDKIKLFEEIKSDLIGIVEEYERENIRLKNENAKLKEKLEAAEEKIKMTWSLSISY